MACIIPFSEENQSITTREQFIAEFMAKRGDYNVFHAYYRGSLSGRCMRPEARVTYFA